MKHSIYSFDYLFIGLGAANSLIIINMFKKGLLHSKKIGIIEPQKKDTNDRTFCFWADNEEVNNLQLAELIKYRWDNIRVGNKVESISPNKYCHIKGIDVYQKVKEILLQINATIFETHFTGEFTVHSNSFELLVNNEKLIANKIFDSSKTHYAKPQKNQSHLFQSFYGLDIEITNGEIDSSAVTMMDFDIPQNNNCQFLYILPYSKTHALFEVTRFGEATISQIEAEEILINYFQKKDIQYRILETENGIIPMSSVPIIHHFDHKNWIFTGAKANMIKPTTGYAFHAMAIHAKEITDALLHEHEIFRKPRPKRFAFYDRLLLKIIETKPEKGKFIFTQLFNKVPTQKVLSFLNERSNLKSEVSIFYKLPIAVFLKGACNDILFYLSKISPAILACFVTLFTLFLNANKQEMISWIMLSIGFLIIGLTHGSLDHLTCKKSISKTHLPKFIAQYLFKAIIIGILWLLVPDIALLVFITYSAWHFGQADFKEWQLKGNISTFSWGLSVILLMLSFHFNETKYILSHIQGLKTNLFLTGISETNILPVKIVILSITAIQLLYYKSKEMAITLAYLMCAVYLPLLMAFGIYFIFQHSLHGWNHLKIKLANQKYLWLQSIPFSLGGAIILSIFTLYYNEIYLGVFFIILSCLSIPHIVSMDQFYTNRFGQNIRQ